MPIVKISPSPRHQFEDDNGVPLAGAKLFTYLAGSTTKQATYKTSVGDTANTNPIILDSAGRTPSGLWLVAGVNYKFVLAPSTDTDPPTSPIFTEDVITGINDQAASQWVTTGLTPTYVNATKFTLAGDQSVAFHVGRRVRFTVTAGTLYGEISTSAYTTLTTITVALDSGVLDSGLSAADLGVITAVNSSFPNAATNVKNFGAVGDGVNNDTAAIQAAFNSGAAEIYYPTGTFLQDTITIPTTVKRVWGPGTIKQRATDTRIFEAANSTGIDLDGLRIQGNYAAGQTTSSSNNRGLVFTSCTGVRVRGCYITNIQYVAVHLIGCNRCVIEGNHFNLVGAAIYSRGTSNSVIAHNTIDTTIFDDTVFTIAISLESTDGHDYGISKHITILGNTVKGFKNAQGIMAHAVTNLTIAGNTVIDPVIGISINPYNATDICSYIAIVGNSVSCIDTLKDYSGGNDGIICQAGGATPDITDITISGNVVINANRAENAAGQGGIRIGYTKRVTIAGNVVTSAQRNGIYVVDSEDHITITGNLVDNVIVGGATQNGIHVAGASSTGYIGGNSFKDLGDASGIGVNYAAACPNLGLGDNQYTNVTKPVANEQNATPGRVKSVTAGTTVDLSGYDAVSFAHDAATTVSNFTGVKVGKLYAFHFTNGNTTIDRTSAYLDGSANKTGTSEDVMLMYGRTTTTLAQAAPMSVNG